MSKKFVVVVGGYECNWSPAFVSRKAAEAWVNRIGEDGGWDERVEVLYEGDTAGIECRECLQYATCDFIEFADGDEAWLCRECQPQPPTPVEMAGSVLALYDDAKAVFMNITSLTNEVVDAEDALRVYQDLARVVHYIGTSLQGRVDDAEPQMWL